MLSVQDLTVILVVAVVLFGAKRLPELGKGIGEGIKSFKKGISEASEIEATPKKDAENKDKTAKPEEGKPA